MSMRRQSKIIWSFDSRLLTRDLAKEVVSARVDALRLVYGRDYSHETLAFLEVFAATKLEKKDDFKPSIILDLSEGPRASIKDLAEPRELNFGDKVTLSLAGKTDFMINARYWDGLFQKDAFVFVGYGHAVLKTLTVNKEQATCEVIQGGTVFPTSEIHIPETRLKPTLKDLDPERLKKILNLGIDYIVLPGLHEVSEVNELRAMLATLIQNVPWLILRIDSKNTYDRARDLMDGAEGIFISRREMALTLDPAAVTIFTKELTQLANDRAKLVFTASEMLGSMRRQPTPTRAEVSDIANAISDGTDALVVSEEVTHGPFGTRAIDVINKIIFDTEQRSDMSLNWVKLTPRIETEMDAVAYGAYTTAERINAKAIVCITISGNTALRLASFRTPIPIIAVTFSEIVNRRMNLVRGVTGLVLETSPAMDDVLPIVNERLLRYSWLKPGDKIVFVSITLSSLGREGSNLFTIQLLT